MIYWAYSGAKGDPIIKVRFLSSLEPYSNVSAGRPSNTSCVSKSTKGTALLSYQEAYNTPNVDWSISALLYDPTQTASMGDVTAALARGWFVTIPDYGNGASTRALRGTEGLTGGESNRETA